MVSNNRVLSNRPLVSYGKYHLMKASTSTSHSNSKSIIPSSLLYSSSTLHDKSKSEAIIRENVTEVNSKVQQSSIHNNFPFILSPTYLILKLLSCGYFVEASYIHFMIEDFPESLCMRSSFVSTSMLNDWIQELKRNNYSASINEQTYESGKWQHEKTLIDISMKVLGI